MKEFSEDRLQIIKEYLDGSPVIKIAEKRGISREAVYQTLRRIENWEELKDIKQDERTSDSKKLAETAAEEIISGKAVGEVLDKYQLSATTLYRHKPEVASYKRKQSAKITKQIAKDWMSGMTYSEISKKYDMFVSNIQRRLHLHFGKDWEKAKKDRKSKSAK